MTLYAVYNGATGGLGRHLGRALDDADIPNAPLRSRLGEVAEQRAELDHLEIGAPKGVVLIHSAALVPVGTAEENPDLAYDVNVARTGATVATFVRWATDRSHCPAILFVSSSHVYAPPERGVPLTEESPTAPLSVYAKTKLAAEDRLRALAAQSGAVLAVARVFGMIGPEQNSTFLLPGLIRRAVTGDVSAVPGLNYVRDILDARDVARHLAGLARQIGGEQSENLVNVCSGEETRIRDLLDLVLAEVHKDDPPKLRAAQASVGAAEGRPTDVTWAVGNPSRLAELTPPPIRTISVASTVADTVAATARPSPLRQLP